MSGQPVHLTTWQWAAVCDALQHYIALRCYEARGSRKDALAALLEIDRVQRGAQAAAPPDDLLGMAHISPSFGEVKAARWIGSACALLNQPAVRALDPDTVDELLSSARFWEDEDWEGLLG